jgi:hypothetical protein
MIPNYSWPNQLVERNHPGKLYSPNNSPNVLILYNLFLSRIQAHLRKQPYFFSIGRSLELHFLSAIFATVGKRQGLFLT